MRQVILGVLLCGVLALVASANTGRYSSRLENVDVDGILKSSRLFNNYYKCIMDQGPSTPEGTELKTVIPDVLVTECSKCSENQKKQAGKIMAFVQLNHPEKWDEVIKKYDKDGVFRKKYGYNEDDDDDDESDEK